eukprot:6208552-Pleurochrysis_carterae.AAC.2
MHEDGLRSARREGAARGAQEAGFERPARCVVMRPADILAAAAAGANLHAVESRPPRRGHISMRAGACHL